MTIEKKSILFSMKSAFPNEVEDRFLPVYLVVQADQSLTSLSGQLYYSNPSLMTMYERNRTNKKERKDKYMKI